MLEIFKIIHVQCEVDTMNASLSNSMLMDLLNATEYSSPCNSTPMNLLSVRDRLRLEREERAIARLRRQRQRDQERRSEQTEVRQTRLATDSHERRAAEQPVARQARLERLRECNVKLQMLGFARIMEHTSFPSLASLACHA